MLIIESILLGVGNGLAPGVLSSWVICEGLRGNTKRFLWVSVAPILFGIVIVPLIVLFVSLLHHNLAIMGVIAIIGALFLFYMGTKQLYMSHGVTGDSKKAAPGEAIFIKAAAINFCNPYGYIFWITIGLPLVYRAGHVSFVYAGIIVGIYYLSLVVSKVCLGVSAQMFSSVFNITSYKRIAQVMGVVFIFFGVYYAFYAVHMLRLWWGS